MKVDFGVALKDSLKDKTTEDDFSTVGPIGQETVEPEVVETDIKLDLSLWQKIKRIVFESEKK